RGGDERHVGHRSARGVRTRATRRHRERHRHAGGRRLRAHSPHPRAPAERGRPHAGHRDHGVRAARRRRARVRQRLPTSRPQARRAARNRRRRGQFGGYCYGAAMTEPGLAQVDPEIQKLIDQENERERDTVRLIASENYASRAVMEATGSVLTNKYSEGYAGKRYYEGQQVIDQVERLAIERV